MCFGGGQPAQQTVAPVVAPAPTPVYAVEPAAANPEVSPANAAAASVEATKAKTRKRLGVFGNVNTSTLGDSTYRKSSVATFGAVGV